MKKNHFIFLLMALSIFYKAFIYSEPVAPVDVSYMVVDLKYSQEQGVKICEVQHGIVSTLHGDLFFYGSPGVIAKNFYTTLSEFQDKSWTVLKNVNECQIRDVIQDAPEWNKMPNLGAIKENADFMHAASLPVQDIYDIRSYHGFLYMRPTAIGNYETFKEKYPGIIVIDAATFPFWIDKYKMSQLFDNNPVLASFKPKWGIYKKKLSTNLSKKIIEDLQCDRIVIKPRGAFLGNGVIIVGKDDLDATLKYILKKSQKLKNDQDKSYSHWYKDSFDSFLVEEFIPSDPIVVPHLENKIYQPTMRVAFLLIYNQQKHDVKFLGSYWLTPVCALSEVGNLNQKHKAYCKPPFYCQVDPKIMAEVTQQLQVALPLLHHEMLNYRK